MPIAEASQTRLAYVPETVIGTTPATPTFQTLRYVSESLRMVKQTDIPDEIRADRNVASIVDVGRSIQGNINGFLSYGTYDALFESLFSGVFTTNVLKNALTPKTFTFEKMFEQGATDSFVTFTGCRVDTLDLSLKAKQSISANFGIKGLAAPAPATTIITGATYTAATTSPVMNAALNVSGLTFTGITNAPVLEQLDISIKANTYDNTIIGQYATYSEGMGRFDVSGTMTAFFENLDTYNAILNHTDIALAVTMGASAGSRYTLSLPKVKLMDGAPVVDGNSRAVKISVPFTAYFDSTAAATAVLTRAV